MAKENKIPENTSFEQALAQLESIVKKLETGTTDLETSLTDYAQGVALKKHCETKLAEAKLKVEKIIESDKGLSLEPVKDA